MKIVNRLINIMVGTVSIRIEIAETKLTNQGKHEDWPEQRSPKKMRDEIKSWRTEQKDPTYFKK